MSDAGTVKHQGQVALGWWARWIQPETGEARALSARLRRASGAVEVLSERPVQWLFGDLDAARPALGRALRADPGRLVLLVRVIAHVGGNESRHLARALGQGDPPALSPARFERLMRIGDDGEALATALIRAMPLLGFQVSCNVAGLATDLLYWGDAVRTRWCFDYFGATAPSSMGAAGLGASPPLAVAAAHNSASREDEA